MTFRYVIDKYGGMWAQWSYTKQNYRVVLPGCYHSFVKGSRGKGSRFLQVRLRRAEGEEFNDNAMQRT
jgi:hypothetical protein